MFKSLYEFCIDEGRTELLDQWDTGANGGLTPQDVSFGSHMKAWWQCDRGHRWQARIASRTAGSDCPYCKNRLLLPGFNDLKSRFPHLAKEWNREKNGQLRPDMVFAGSRRKVWWRCDRGHVWQASIQARTTGTGCPVCAGKVVLRGEGDLTTMFPHIAKEWHPTKNGTLTPDRVTPYSNRRVWWVGDKGHEYVSVIARRTAGLTGCPDCSGPQVQPGYNDLLSREPELCKEWHADMNGSLTPDQVTPGSHKMVWWRCAQGHVWKAAIYARTGKQRSGCPVCAGKVKPGRNAGKIPGAAENFPSAK